MNRFRTRKRAKDDSAAPEQSSMSAFKSFRRGKKSTEEEPKKEFDLMSALPSDDNFRTSLLMTNLSARFSMLREQDDPNTKIGKASDDSVLFPKRQSRLGDFGFSGGLGQGLSDIAEVESIKAPFLRGQVDSYISEDGDSTRGGIMNRGKPTEGNVLFGGRQKIYKIPVGGKASGAGAMGGRALYEDDVAVSAFQLWRQAEKNRRSSGSDSNDSTPVGPDAEEAELPRSESPPLVGYNRKRETSSTTSSASAIGRYSTAATSVNSQPATSIRESHLTGNSSVNSTPALERSVTRTRRLYEQALTQDMHGQQSPAFSRIDTFARQRTIGNRTPDPAQVSPSPTSVGFNERFAERRPILTKASAPNLRSLSPPTTASSSSTLDLGIKAGPQQGSRSLFGGSPPLSPPISETGDNGMMPIQPNDRGKATAMGVFQKPAEPYDESKYAQRQLQLQSGRDTPESRSRAESNASFTPTWRSQSSSSVQRQPIEAKAEPARRTEPTVREEYGNGGTFLDDSDGSPLFGTGKPKTTPQVVLQRPSDTDHPAFRPAALPTPVSPSEMTMSESKQLDKPDTSVSCSQHASPPDSPTLGPTSAGLSGMVRQHLRSESNTSSVYGNEPPTAGFEARFAVEPRESMVNGFGAKSNPWISRDSDYAGVRSSPNTNDYVGHVDFKEATSSDHRRSSHPSTDEPESEPDEFASRLEDARRRVREKLTSYAEADSSRESSPHRHADPLRDTIGQLPQPNALGIGLLKPKSSRGSLIDRSRTKVGGSQSKAMKMLGIGAVTMATSPSSSKQSFDEKDRETPRPSMEQEANVRDRRQDHQSTNGDAESETDNKSIKEKEEENVHPGLRAFRNARRELQRRKELETLAKHQASQKSAGPQRTDQEHAMEPSGRQRTPSRERKPPPVLYQQRAPSSEPRYRQGSSSDSSSRQTSTERDRTGSEANYGRTDGRPPRLRNNSSPHDGSQLQPKPTNGLRPLMLRSPGLPGTDIRRSPIMPPLGYPGSAPASAVPSPKYLDRSRSASNLNVQPSRAPYESISGQPSPISPLPDSLVGLPSGSAAPNGRRPSVPQSPGFSTTTSTVNDSHRRTVNKHDISDPTFIMSTSRVPTVTLAEGATRSRSGTNSSQNAPPLPPINPRRKRTGDNQDEFSTTPGVSPLPSPLPVAGTNGYESSGRRRGASGTDEEGSNVRAIRNTLAHNDGQRSPYYPQHPSPNQYIAAGPPASRTVLTPRLKPSKAGAPGGMF